MGVGGDVRITTITKALMGTRPIVYHSHQMSVARDKEIFGMSSVIETLVTALRIVTKRETDSSVSIMMKGAMISTGPTMTSLPDVALRTKGAMKEESRLSATI
jgi:hypothetical protein